MLPTIGIKSDSRELALCLESYPDFRTVLHGKEDVVLAVDRHEFHHAVPETDIVFGDGVLAFFQERKEMRTAEVKKVRKRVSMKKLLAEKKVEVAEREKKPPEVNAPSKRPSMGVDD